LFAARPASCPENNDTRTEKQRSEFHAEGYRRDGGERVALQGLENGPCIGMAGLRGCSAVTASGETYFRSTGGLRLFGQKMNLGRRINPEATPADAGRANGHAGVARFRRRPGRC
jgi:hypothetical protein